MTTAPHRLRQLAQALTIAALLAATPWMGTACKPEHTGPGGPLTFSRDSVIFDTLFTTVASPTERLLVFNNSNSDITVTTLRVGRGDGSPFKLICNGVKGQLHRDVIVPARDSIYLFFDMQTAGNGDVTDELVLELADGQTQRITLFANVIDAYFYRKDTLPCGPTRLPNDKPVVIDDILYVPQCATLTIDPGTKVYFTSRNINYNFLSQIKVDGTIRAEGNPAAPILFTNFRLVAGYQEASNQWLGLYLAAQSSDNLFQFCEIRNSVVGFIVDSLSANAAAPKLTLSNVEVHNVSNYGIYALGRTRNYGVLPTIAATNLLIYDVGQAALLTAGGWGQYVNCTFGLYGFKFRRALPAVVTVNWAKDTANNILPFDTRVVMQNCILYGTEDEEFGTDLIADALAEFSFTNCLIRSKDRTAADFPGANNLVNQDPLFNNPAEGDFALKASSPALGAGDPTNAPTVDLLNRPRPANTPAIGALEQAEE